MCQCCVCPNDIAGEARLLKIKHFAAMDSYLHTYKLSVNILITLQKISNKTTATKKVMLRAINLFLLGLLLQGILSLFH